MKRTMVLVGLLLIVIGCTEKKVTMCPDMRPECLVELLKHHPTRQPDYWSKYFTKSPQERIYTADESLIDFVSIDNKKEGIPNIPRIPQLDQGFLNDIRSALQEIPQSVWRLVDKRFAGVFLISNLGGTGLTDYIFDQSGKKIGAFVVLDVDILNKRTANQWATWKESTPFNDNPNYSIEAVIEKAQDDNRKNAIQYIVLHELAHVQSVGENYHPDWWVKPGEVPDMNNYPFVRDSWLFNSKTNKYFTKYDETIFPKREKVIYYFGAKLDASDMVDVYDDLEKTDFVTLYGATHPADDWAEGFVTYVHNQLMGRVFHINVKKNGKTIKNFSLCWDQPRCQKKREFFKQLFK